MKSHTKSSLTLPPEEFQLVQHLKEVLHLRSNVDVVRAGLRLLRESTEREALRDAFRKASRATRASLRSELDELRLGKVPRQLLDEVRQKLRLAADL